MYENSLEYDKDYFATKLENLEKENLRISEQNLKYKHFLQIGLSYEKILEDVKGSLDIVNAHCMFLCSSEKNNSLIEHYIKNIEFSVAQIIQNISQNLDNLQNFPENFFKNGVNKI